jgi:hypothetical protein
MPQFMHKTNQHIFSKLTRICVRPEDFISRVIQNDDQRRQKAQHRSSHVGRKGVGRIVVVLVVSIILPEAFE